jgi:hypothetical protein
MTTKATSLRTTALAMLVLVSVAACGDQSDVADDEAADATAPTAAAPATTPPAAADAGPTFPVRFGDQIMLQNVVMACAGDILHIRTVWSPLAGRTGEPLSHAVHLLDENNKIAVNMDTPVKPWEADATLDTLRPEPFRVAPEKQAKAVKLALGVYQTPTIKLLPMEGAKEGQAPLVIMPLMKCTP